jgi:hypothetical protein
MDIANLDKIYSLYRFEKVRTEEHCIVYLYQGGYFSNVEIFELKKGSPQNDEIFKLYSDIGHSVRKVSYSSNEEAHEALFRGFFKVKETKKKLMHEYDEYCKSQTYRLTGDRDSLYQYEYVEGSFYKDGELLTDKLINIIYDELFEDNSKLVILEAAAGFGKTCTSYEVLCKLVNEDREDKFVPMLAELSKNRKAALFRYVLLSEINNSFTGLSYELVMHEIRLGKIPLIIDGFDELLSKTADDSEQVASSKNEEAQTMLDTIAQLLTDDSKAKILLTSRKSSIFIGEIFDKWMEEKVGACEVVRVQLCEPTIAQWIGPEKQQLLKEKGIFLDVIPNPVLLAFIRNLSERELTDRYKSSDDILNSYFELLLSRERERQQILLSWRDQYNLMVSLAAIFVKYDISSEESSFIKSVFEDLLSPSMPQYLGQYNELSEIDTDFRPANEDEFINKFVHHALLDRVSFASNKIGFINDFVFGIMIGEALCQSILLPDDMLSEKYIDICTTAYSVRSAEICKDLYEKLDIAIQCLNKSQQLNIDLILLHHLSQNYNKQTFESISFKSHINFSEYSFNECTFTSCIFDHCTIPTSLFYGCSFYNCKFYEVEVIRNTSDNRNLSFWGKSEGYESLAGAGLNDKIEIVSDINYKKKVLEQYFKPGYAKAELNKERNTLYRGFSESERISVSMAIDELIKEDLLIQMLRVIKLNTKKLNEIHKLVGR